MIKGLTNSIRFLLAQLHLNLLIDKTSPKAFKYALEKLPQKSDALDWVYNHAMTRIDNQEASFIQLADKILAWIMFAQRPLTIVELQHTLAIEKREPELDRENITIVEESVSVCVGLMVIDQETSTIQQVHYTTQEYFRKICIQRFLNVQKLTAAACLTYLLLTCLQKRMKCTRRKISNRTYNRMRLNTPLIIGATMYVDM